MQFSEMVTSLRVRVGNPTTTDAPDSTLKDILNRSYLDIADRYRFHKVRKRCTFRTVADQSRYDLPNDLLAVLRVSDTTNFVKLEKIGDRQLSSRTSPNTTGKPTQYVRYRSWIELSPIPDLGDGVTTGYVMEVWYKYQLPKLINDGDQPELPLSWHEGVVMFGKYKYYEDVADGPKAAAAYEAWKLWVVDKPTEIDDESVDIDSGVEILTLSQNISPRLDFNHSD